MKPNSIKQGSPQADRRRILNNIEDPPRRNQQSIINNHFKALPRLCTYKSFMRNKPNFQKSGLTITLDMIRTYNEN